MIWYAGIPATRGTEPTPIMFADLVGPASARLVRYAYRRLRRGGCDATTSRVALSHAFFAGRQAGMS